VEYDTLLHLVGFPMRIRNLHFKLRLHTVKNSHFLRERHTAHMNYKFDRQEPIKCIGNGLPQRS